MDTTRSAPTLPVELWQLVLAYAFPPPSCDADGVRTRQRNLAPLAHVCKSWSWVRDALYEHVALGTAEQAQALARTLDARDGLAATVKTLCLGVPSAETVAADSNGAGFILRNLLQKCQRVETLILNKVEGIALGDLAASSSLRSLHLSDVGFDPDTAPEAALAGLPSVLSEPKPERYATPEWHSLRCLQVGRLPYSSLGAPDCAALSRLPLLFLSTRLDSWSGWGCESELAVVPPTVRVFRVTANRATSADTLVRSLASAPTPSNASEDFLPSVEELILPIGSVSADLLWRLEDWAARRGVKVLWEELAQEQNADEGFWRVADRVEREVKGGRWK
ncbi:hypothetical protein JCM10207_006084 [Rhodosporidiobolus poonsookiae]